LGLPNAAISQKSYEKNCILSIALKAFSCCRKITLDKNIRITPHNIATTKHFFLSFVHIITYAAHMDACGNSHSAIKLIELRLLAHAARFLSAHITIL